MMWATPTPTTFHSVMLPFMVLIVHLVTHLLRAPVSPHFDVHSRAEYKWYEQLVRRAETAV